MKKLILYCLFLIFLDGCKCPNLLSPAIVTTTSHPDLHSDLLLGVRDLPHATVLWKGPDTVFTGNIWLRSNVTNSMAGDYQAQYISSRRQKCISPASIVHIDVKDCPELPAPKVEPGDRVYQKGTTIVLGTNQADHTVIRWNTPKGEITANSLIIESATTKAAGEYSAKLVYPGIAGCESKETKFQVYVYDPVIKTKDKIKYKGNDYLMKIKWDGPTAQVFLSPDTATHRLPPGAVALAEILIFEIKIFKAEVNALPTLIQKTVVAVDDAEGKVGCLSAAGGYGCIMGAEGGTEFLPVCEILVSNIDKELAACVDNVAGDIAEKVGFAKDWYVHSAAKHLTEKQFKDATKDAIEYTAVKEEGETPMLNKSGDIVATPPPPPPPPPAPRPGSGHGGGGQPPTIPIIPIDPCNGCYDMDCGCNGGWCICGTIDWGGDGDDDRAADPDFSIVAAPTASQVKVAQHYLAEALGGKQQKIKIQAADNVNRVLKYAKKIMGFHYGNKIFTNGGEKPFNVYKRGNYWVIVSNAVIDNKKQRAYLVVNSLTGVVSGSQLKVKSSK